MRYVARFCQPACRRCSPALRRSVADTAVSRDVIVFDYPRQRFFTIVSYCGVAQLLFWLQHSYYFNRPIAAPLPERIKDNTIVRIITGHSERPKSLAALFLTVGESAGPPAHEILTTVHHHRKKTNTGVAVCATAVFYSARSVRCLTLLRGGKEMRITTFGFLGRPRSFTTTIDRLNCTSRSTSYVPLRVRGRRHFFIVDTKHGTLTNKLLFDHTAGMSRKWK